jgi:general secretion pathway protein I
MTKSNYRARGFTLIEVLIALTVVALSAGALLGAVTSSASNVIYLKEKTLAEWVALNRLTEIRMAVDMPGEGRRKGSTTMAGMRWEWEEEVTELPVVEGLFRVDVRAHATGELVDDSGPVQQSSSQTVTPTTSSGSSSSKTNWTSTVTGVIGSSRSAIRQPVAAPFAGTPNNNPGQPGGAPPPNQPGGAPPPNPPKPGAPSS